MEQFDAMSGYSFYEPYSNSYYDSYNEGWEDYPSYCYEENQEFTQNPYHQWMQPPPQTTLQIPNSSIEDMFYALVWEIMQFRRETRESLRNLENQIGELTASMKELEENSIELLSQTVVNMEDDDCAIAMARDEHEIMEEEVQGDEFQHGATSWEKVNNEPLNSDFTNDIVSPFHSKLAKAYGEEANKPPLQDIALAKIETSSPKASVGENASLVLQGTSSPIYGDAILETHTDSGSFIDDSLEIGNLDFLGVERFLQTDSKDAEILGEWVDMNQFFDIREDKKNCGNFENLPSILKFDLQWKNLHQPITATTMALAILAIDGIEKFSDLLSFSFPFPFCFVLFYFVFRILLPSYIEDNVVFKCGGGF